MLFNHCKTFLKILPLSDTMIKFVCLCVQNDDGRDNVESNLLTSSLLKIRSLYKFCYKVHMLSVSYKC